MTHHRPCPCCSNDNYQQCCGPFIDNQTLAETPLQLMRSRFCAYRLGKIDYIKETMRGNAAKEFDERAALEWSKRIVWGKLRIISAPPFKACHGRVEFEAHFIEDQHYEILHEVSDFEKIDGRWYYTGSHTNHDITTKKISKNGPCPCNSGAKFKRCCGKSKARG